MARFLSAALVHHGVERAKSDDARRSTVGSHTSSGLGQFLDRCAGIVEDRPADIICVGSRVINRKTTVLL
jgi:hypothetical protein